MWVTWKLRSWACDSQADFCRSHFDWCARWNGNEWLSEEYSTWQLDGRTKRRKRMKRRKGKSNSPLWYWTVKSHKNISHFVHNWNASNDVKCLYSLINMQWLNRKIYDSIRIILCDSKWENIRRNYFILPSFLRSFSFPFRLVFLVFKMEFLRDSHFMIGFYDWHFRQSEPFIRAFLTYWQSRTHTLTLQREREKFPVGERILRLLHVHFFHLYRRNDCIFLYI